jgi:hypothetical protein
MRSFSSTAFWLVSLATAASAGCQRDDNKVLDRLDKMQKSIDDLSTAVKTMPKGGAAMGQRPDRPRPKPDVTYAVETAGGASRGPENALVTIVEGFDFA